MIYLPTDKPQQWPQVRILYAPNFNLGAGPWFIQPMWSGRDKGYGFEFIECNRTVLPGIGEATFQYKFGEINGDFVGIETPASAIRRIPGAAWDPSVDTNNAPDLHGYDIRIQVAPPYTPGADQDWKTVWWGQVEYQEDTIFPGSAYPAGIRTYRCVDGFARTARWPMNRHSTGESPIFYMDSEGHPGYNVGINGRILGNRDTSITLSQVTQDSDIGLPGTKELRDRVDTGYGFHCFQGNEAAHNWTVLTALQDALRKTRGVGEPIFNFQGSVSLLGDTIAIPVKDGDSAFDIVARVCRRERGRGVVFVDWIDDVSDPAGLFTVYLTVNPQTLDDITFTIPSTGATQTIDGAGTAATTVDVDLIGDHRIVADGVKLGDRFIHVADAVETTSENIQLLTTISYYDTIPTIEPRWAIGRESTFAALTTTQRPEAPWDPIWNIHGLKRLWNGNCADHNGGNILPCDYACDDNGNIITSMSSGRLITSPFLCKVLPDLPIYEGYDYTSSNNLRKIGDQAGNDELGQPARAKPFAVIRVGNNKYITGSDLIRQLTLQIRGRDILAYSHDDLKHGSRIISDTSIANLSAQFGIAALGFTIGLELPHKIRRRSVRTDAFGVALPPESVKRVINIRLSDMHLWIAQPNAIWSLDRSSGSVSTGFSPKRNAVAGTVTSPGLIRDDRDALSRIHAMACAWYLVPRQTASWRLKACGMLPSFESFDAPLVNLLTPTDILYPTLGQLVTEFQAAGQINTLNTPITNIHYNHVSGETTWETDWQQLDTQ